MDVGALKTSNEILGAQLRILFNFFSGASTKMD